MKTTVALSIFDGSETPMMQAEVNFYEDDAYYHRNAKVLVFIEKTVTDLKEIKKLAIQRAYDFLSTVQSARAD